MENCLQAMFFLINLSCTFFNYTTECIAIQGSWIMNYVELKVKVFSISKADVFGLDFITTVTYDKNTILSVAGYISFISLKVQYFS